MRYRPIDREPDDPRLDRLIPDDWRHVEHYPLRALPDEEKPARVPVVIGINWYDEMYAPEFDEELGEYFVARGGVDALTTISGGHCVCLEPGESTDRSEWWRFYNQGREGGCVGFGWSRCMSLLSGKLYKARWLGSRAQDREAWVETSYSGKGGTSVRAAAEILVDCGHVAWEQDFTDPDYRGSDDDEPATAKGLSAVRWAESVDAVHAILLNPKADALGAVPMLNSWGIEYPHRAWLPDGVLDRLISEQGEIAVPTDR